MQPLHRIRYTLATGTEYVQNILFVREVMARALCIKCYYLGAGRGEGDKHMHVTYIDI